MGSFFDKNSGSKQLDLVMRDTDFVIYNGQSPLTTPKGNEFSHSDSRLLKHLLIKLSMQEETRTNYDYGIYACYRDLFSGNTDADGENLVAMIVEDPLLRTRFSRGEHTSIFNPSALLDLPGDNQIMNLMVLGASVIMKGMRDYLSGMENFKVVEKDFPAHRGAVIEFLKQKYLLLPPEKKAVVALLSVAHSNSLILPSLLVSSCISPSEYALTSLAIHTNYTQGKLPEPAFDGISGVYLEALNVDWGHAARGFGDFLEMASATTEFLEYFEDSGRRMSVIGEIIAQGENDTVEFKSTFRWDIRQNKKNPAIEHAALKSMAAFLNSDGGDLLLGVADDGSIVGIETDNFPNDDKFLLHVWMLIKSSMGQDISPFIKTTLEKTDEKTVCRVQCLRSPKPVFLRQSGFDEMFYIRIGPSSGNLEISEALKYIGNRF
jgi:hypothetical protein